MQNITLNTIPPGHTIRLRVNDKREFSVLTALSMRRSGTIRDLLDEYSATPQFSDVMRGEDSIPLIFQCPNGKDVEYDVIHWIISFFRSEEPDILDCKDLSEQDFLCLLAISQYLDMPDAMAVVLECLSGLSTRDLISMSPEIRKYFPNVLKSTILPRLEAEVASRIQTYYTFGPDIRYILTKTIASALTYGGATLDELMDPAYAALEEQLVGDGIHFPAYGHLITLFGVIGHYHDDEAGSMVKRILPETRNGFLMGSMNGFDWYLFIIFESRPRERKPRPVGYVIISHSGNLMNQGPRGVFLRDQEGALKVRVHQKHHTPILNYFDVNLAESTGHRPIDLYVMMPLDLRGKNLYRDPAFMTHLARDLFGFDSYHEVLPYLYEQLQLIANGVTE